MLYKISLQNTLISVELENDYYGSEYWNKIADRTYEPDTVGFLEDNCDENTDFLDIGTANGAMSIIAAFCGARVFGYEPDPVIYEVATKNFHLNPVLNSKIHLQNIALSSYSGSTMFGSSEFSDVLSSIVVAGFSKIPSKEIAIIPLFEELDRVHSDKARKLVVKMDIEGAEWKIIESQECLDALKNHSAKMLLALHPGFHRPFKHFSLSPNRLRYILWHFKNFQESLRAFKKMHEVAYIYRTNLNPVIKPRSFALLVLAGYHEFIVDFK